MFATSLLSATLSAILSVSSAFALPSTPCLPAASDQLLLSKKSLDMPEMAEEVRLMTVTAYSSSRDQTDDTPFTTASNTRVRDGVVAVNALPFGTRVRIPSIFGDREFVVEDRMHRRYKNRIDIWFSSRREALRFGIIHRTLVEVLR